MTRKQGEQDVIVVSGREASPNPNIGLGTCHHLASIAIPAVQGAVTLSQSLKTSHDELHKKVSSMRILHCRTGVLMPITSKFEHPIRVR